MTSAASHPPFEFFPQVTQDAELLRQLQFLPGLKELLTVRQVHALEHATVWVLSEGHLPLQPGASGSSPSATSAASEQLGGMSTERGFYLYGNVPTSSVQQAVAEALRRLTTGEWDLAVHPRCGTNLSVGLLLTAGLSLGLTWLLPKDPLTQVLSLGAAATAAAGLAPDLGRLAQRYVTTAIPFNLAVREVTVSRDRWQQPTHFVRVEWVESA